MVATIICSLVGHVQTADKISACLKFYRRDLMQVWAIKNTSLLCTINTVSLAENRFGLQAFKDKLYINAKGINSTVDDNWRTAAPSVGGDFGIAVYRKENNRGLILRFLPTSDKTKQNTFSYEGEDDEIKNYNRTTYYLPEGDIVIESGEYTHTLNRWLLILVTSGAVVAAFYTDSNAPCTVGIAGMILSASVIEGALKIEGTWTFIMVFTGLLFLGAAYVYLTHLVKKGNDYIGIVMLVILLGYQILASSFLFLLVSKLVILFLIGISSFFAIRDSVYNKSELVLTFISIGVFFSTVMVSIYTTFVLNLPALFVAIETGQTDYIEGENTTGIVLLVICPLLGILLSIPEIMLCRRIRKMIDDSVSLSQSFI